MADQPDQKSPEWVRSLALFGVIVSDLVVCTGIGIGLGYWAWKKWNAPWWVILVTSLAGLTLAMYRLYRAVQVLDQKK